MRRLLPLALLLVPAIARADDGTIFQPLFGCSGAYCFELSILASDPGSVIVNPYALGLNYSTGPLIGTIYDQNGNLWLSFVGLERDAPKTTGTPTTAILEDVVIRDEHGTVLESLGDITLTTTPEPASLILLGTGMLGVAAVRRRRQA